MSECRFCKANLRNTFVDLGVSPLANSYLSPDDLGKMEPFYPLHAYVCGQCFLVQLEMFESPQQIFNDYLYFSSYSDLWLKHAANYVEAIEKVLGLNKNSLVVEIASNDGYLLKNFVARGIPVLGIEPAANVAEVARKQGIPSEVCFFGVETAKRLLQAGKQADLMVANNVLAHVPDINDFVAGFKILLKPQGTATFEFPHLLRLINENQFDTIYHEHFSYISLIAAVEIFKQHGLRIYDVEELETHGGSLRIYVRLVEHSASSPSARVEAVLQAEEQAGLKELSTYARFNQAVARVKLDVLSFLVNVRKAGKRVVAYGAPAKGNTLLNYCGIGPELIEFSVDRSPHKQGKFLPGSRLPIKSPQELIEARPDYVFILPWNIKSEIMQQMAQVREWGGKFVVPIPELQVL